jgi:tRNA U34 5-methylaminomethyl-2-thiouridine-forming methyltransferase MnmC
MNETVKTGDGSNTLYHTSTGEHYHSVHGAVSESRHVFIEAGLKHFLSSENPDQVRILEIGFGTGLNFLLSATHCENTPVTLSYTGIEAYPLTADKLLQTEYHAYTSPLLWGAFLTNYPYVLTRRLNILVNCDLTVIPQKLSETCFRDTYDIIYFDAFSAIHQPELWTKASIAHCTNCLNEGGIFVTYAITGELKRNLRSLGFTVEKLPGAPGKREMLRATKNAG